MKKITAAILIILIIFSSAAFAADEGQKTAQYILENVPSPTVSSIGGEWAIIGLARGGFNVPADYFEKYYSALTDFLKVRNGVLHTRKLTEYSRVILAVGAMGKNPENVAGYDLTAPLMNVELVGRQGINGTIWALIALKGTESGTEAVREAYVAEILKSECAGGGWSLAKDVAEADVTAMALSALSFYRGRADVDAAISRALAFLSAAQTDDGGFLSGEVKTSESAAQVVTALSALNIPVSDERFTKNGKTVLDSLLSFRNADGSFSHTTESNLMATEQGLYALVAYERFLAGEDALFNMKGDKKAAVPDVKYPGRSFSDIKNSEYRQAIEALAERGIITGMTDELFCGDKTLTRAEFTAIAVRAIGLSPQQTDKFSDVESDAWFSPYVGAAYLSGIIKGTSDTSFNPSGQLKNEEVYVMLYRMALLLGDDEVKYDNVFAEGLSEWASSASGYLISRGVIDKVYAPQRAITREETAQLLFNLLKGAELI